MQLMNNRTIRLQDFFSNGITLLQSGKAEQALACFREAQEIDPSNPVLHLHIGAALHDLKRFEDATVSYEYALLFSPSMGEIHNNLGNSLMALGRFNEAIASFSRAINLLPLSPIPLTARATAHQALKNVSQAEADCRNALILDPTFASAHWNLALSLLLQGQYVEGWLEYEWRWRRPDFTSPCRHFNFPLWGGDPLNGQSILLHAEQGFGDTIQFIRYASLVAECGGKVILECHPQLVTLMLSVEGVHSAIPFGAPLPTFTCQAPLLSLPRIFGTELQSIPSQCPYLSVTAEKKREWVNKLSTHPNAFRVGIAWAGKSYPDPLRSCSLTDLASLATDQNIIWYSLQLGNGAEQSSSPPAGMNLFDFTDQIHDFEDTAALIEQMDLVISIDTSVAHLAGALGKPVLTLLPFAPDWRWLLDRKGSPWYPSMSLFRQKSQGDWSDAITAIKVLLDSIPKQKKSSETFQRIF